MKIIAVFAGANGAVAGMLVVGIEQVEMFTFEELEPGAREAEEIQRPEAPDAAEFARKRLGLEPEGRKYTPHVTLARLRETSSRQVADYLATRGFFRSPSFEVSRFVLFSSRASVGGGPYVVEADYPLDALAPGTAGGSPGEGRGAER